jgi:hypothetical protein
LIEDGASDGFDFEPPEELREWLEYQREKNPDMGIEHYVYEKGKIRKVDLLEWAKWFEDFENRRLEYTEEEGFCVSTVFLGIDHSFIVDPALDHKPILFETCILRGPKEYDQNIFRYASLGEAKNGHYAIVQALREGRAPIFGGEPSIFNFLTDREDLDGRQEEEGED